MLSELSKCPECGKDGYFRPTTIRQQGYGPVWVNKCKCFIPTHLWFPPEEEGFRLGRERTFEELTEEERVFIALIL